MKTQYEYMREIETSFMTQLVAYRGILDSYCYNDHRACDRIMAFKERIKTIGLELSNCHHANGIGNNNDYTIFLKTVDEDGFVIHKNIANFYYCYGIYGGCYVMLQDLSTGKKITVGRAR